ncbi:hypothetical protein MY4038_002239 [Beauveria bassiana]
MPLGLSPYVTSTSVSQENRFNPRMENDRPSPLRISKQINSTTHTRGGNYDQHPVYPAQEFIHPLQKHSANHLNISKRRSLWALSSQFVEHEEPRDVPPRPYSVSPNMALTARFSPMPDEKSEGKDPRPAEVAEEMLREASLGALKQHNVGSAWSPPPIYSLESIESAMQRHWKADVVAKWLQRIKDSERAGIQKSTKQGENAAEELQEANCREPMHRPAISMETMCQKMTANRLSESHRHVQSPDYGNERRELKPATTNMGSLRSRRSWSRNTSGTTCTSGSLRKKKSFAAGI